MEDEKRGMKTKNNYQSKADSQNLSSEANTDADTHVACRQGTRIRADIGLIDFFTEIVMCTAKTTVEQRSKSRFRPTAIGRSMLWAIAEKETEGAGKSLFEVNESTSQRVNKPLCRPHPTCGPVDLLTC